MLQNPVVLSSSTGGICQFTVCYRGQAPQFLTPTASGAGTLNDLSIAQLDKTIPQFTWRQPVVSCNAAAALQFTYEFRVVELLPGQNPDDAMDRNANFYIARNLTVPMATIPVTYVNRMDLSKTYVAQVKATQSGVGSKMLNYVMLENGGKSPFRQFRVYQPEVKEEGGDNKKTDEDDKADNDKKDQDKKDQDKKDQDKKDEDKKDEEDDDDDVADAGEVGGEGGDKGKEAALKGKAFYTKTLKGAEDDEYLIDWDAELKDKKLAHGQYIVLRVKPRCLNEKSIRYTGDGNVMDMALSERLSQSYFQCASTVTVSNSEPTKKKESELKGSKVAIGEYTLTIDEIKKVKNKDYSLSTSSSARRATCLRHGPTWALRCTSVSATSCPTTACCPIRPPL